MQGPAPANSAEICLPRHNLQPPTANLIAAGALVLYGKSHSDGPPGSLQMVGFVVVAGEFHYNCFQKSDGRWVDILQHIKSHELRELLGL